MERLDDFMARANARYYAACDPFADFTTAPEISQVFGEILGLWAAAVWEAMGAPEPVLLAEAGPGRGTMMADALRAVRAVAPGFAAALSLHLVETSQRLCALQAARLPDARWHEAISGLPEGPLILFANEFLDALPIRQFVRRAGGWAERFVADGGFAERAATPPHPLPAAADGVIFELRPAAEAFVAHLAGRIARSGGAALLIDYGPEASGAGDSLQALHQGRPADPLGPAGDADLTAHVDFAALARVARAAGAAAHGPLPQGLFLTRLGLFQRIDRLARGAGPGAALAQIAAARRLAEPDGMGRLFKVLAILPAGIPEPPGFTP